jgi:hypothetical protein
MLKQAKQTKKQKKKTKKKCFTSSCCDGYPFWSMKNEYIRNKKLLEKAEATLVEARDKLQKITNQHTSNNSSYIACKLLTS